MSDLESFTPAPQQQKQKQQNSKASGAAAAATSQQQVVPPHKVGRSVMYDQFVGGYDAIMKKHDCSAIQRVLAERLSLLFTKSSAPAVFRVADLGCGTGRGSKLLLDAFCLLPAQQRQQQQQRQFQICGVDKSSAMVQKFVSELSAKLTSQHGVTELALFPVRSAPWSSSSASASASAVSLSLSSSSSVWGAVASLEDFCVATEGSGAASVVTPFEPSPVVDVVICAWALSHVASAQWGGDRWHANVRRVVAVMEGSIDPRTGGLVVVIETLGTDTETPTRHSSLHDFLVGTGEAGVGFETPVVVRTDYVFDSLEDGERCVRFFFGDEMRLKFAARVAAAQQDPSSSSTSAFRLPECTGIWIKKVPPASAASAAAAAAAESPQRRDRGAGSQ